MRLFVTGSTGYVGQDLVRRLISAGHTPVCLVRPASEKKLADVRDKIEIISGDMNDVDFWKTNLTDIDAIINLIGIIREFPSRGITFERHHYLFTIELVKLANEAGVKRFIQMSALGSSPDSRAAYHRTKFRAEEYLRASDLEWTILRPSLIIGQGNEALATMVKLIDSSPITPVIGSGDYRLQPVDIANVGDAFVKALNNRHSIGKTYDLVGPDRMTYNQMLEKISAKLGKKIKRLSMPVGLMKLVSSPFEYFSSFPLTRGQIDMLLEENISDSTEIYDDLQIEPINFEDSLKKALKSE